MLRTPTILRDALARLRANTGLTALLFVVGITLVSAAQIYPKLLAIEFVNEHMWGEIGVARTLTLILQDAALALSVFVATCWCVWRRKFRLLPLVLGASGLMLLILMLDVRVRQLWLKPSDFGLVRYGLDNSSSLGSGLELFFNRDAGLGMTFRRGLVVTFGIFVLGCGAIWMTARSLRQWPAAGSKALLYAALAIPCLLLSSRAVPSARYRLETNILVNPVASLGDGWFGGRAEAAEDSRFEQMPEPVSARLAAPLSVELGLAEPQLAELRGRLKNLVIVFLESMRWRDIDLDTGAHEASTLARFAREGAFAKAYVTIPHSSKAYFAVLTGRNPYPGIEMREVLEDRQESIIHALKTRTPTDAYALSSMTLVFENVNGMLRSFGVETRLETSDMLKDAGGALDQSSFGTEDGPLYGLAAERLARSNRPFAAILFPTAAHYPYNCADPKDTRANHTAYLACIVHSDRLLSDMVKQFEAKGLLKDTLFVLVGDHGEAFGEHGVFAHNSSVYEEEVTVPLVFWMADGGVNFGRLPDGRQIDIAPTIADLFGLESKLPVQGQSLLRASASPAIFMSTFFDGSALALLESPTKFVYEPATDQLVRFDLRADPLEKRGVNVSAGRERDAVIRRLRAFQTYHRSVF